MTTTTPSDPGFTPGAPIVPGSGSALGTTMKVVPRRARIAITILGRHLDKAPISFSSDDQSGAYQDLIQCIVHKDLGETTGAFTLILTRRTDAQGRTWAQKISPMDYVEIKLAGGATEPYTTVMRGFVTNPNGQETFAQGKPQMAVVIEGHDYGKLLVRCNLFLVTSDNKLLQGGDITDEMAHLFWTDRWGISGDDAYAMKPSEFLKAICDMPGGILDSFISLKDAPPLTPVVNDDQFRSSFRVPAGSSTAVLGSVQNLLDQFKCAPWYEIFLTEGEQGPEIHWRLTPYEDPTGQPIVLEGASPPETIATTQVGMAEVIDRQIGRSDTDQYSYFMTMPEILSSADAAVRALFGQPQEWGGTAKWLRGVTLQYGFRTMEVPFPLLWFPDTGDESSEEAQSGNYIDDVTALNNWLAAAFGDVYKQEAGTIDVMGRPGYRVGTYLAINETQQRFYIEGVEHNFAVDPPAYTTKLTLTRGRWPASVDMYDSVPADDSATIGGPPIGAPASFPAQIPLGGGGGGGGGGSLPSGGGGGVGDVSSNAPLPSGVAPGDTSSLPKTPGGCITPNGRPYTTGRDNITQGFGVSSADSSGPHRGIDFANALGHGVYAAQGGTVIGTRACFKGTGSLGNESGAGCGPFLGVQGLTNGYGSYIFVANDDGTWSVYGHSNPAVQVGQRIGPGSLIGTSDFTGDADGPHTHFETRSGGPFGTPIDPVAACHGSAAS